MNVLVFVKQVADTEARIIISSDQKTLEIENKYAVNFFDEFAVEEAIRIKEVLKDVQGVAMIRFTDEDVIRHPLVGRIVRAYDQHRLAMEARKGEKL